MIGHVPTSHRVKQRVKSPSLFFLVHSIIWGRGDLHAKSHRVQPRVKSPYFPGRSAHHGDLNIFSRPTMAATLSFLLLSTTFCGPILQQCNTRRRLPAAVWFFCLLFEKCYLLFVANLTLCLSVQLHLAYTVI